MRPYSVDFCGIFFVNVSNFRLSQLINQSISYLYRQQYSDGQWSIIIRIIFKLSPAYILGIIKSNKIFIGHHIGTRL